jgi:peroxin-3
MFSTLRNYVAERKGGIAKTAGFVGGLYIAKSYISDRLDEVKVRLEQERTAKDRQVCFFSESQVMTRAYLFLSLRRRFQQTQEDVSYTALALLPTLGDQILEYMDVEAITKELQNRSKARNARHHSQVSSSITSSIDVVQEHDVRSDCGSIAPSVASTGLSFGDPDSAAATAPQIVSQPSESVHDPSSASVVASSTSSAISGENLSLHSSQLVRHSCILLKTSRLTTFNAVRPLDDLLCCIRVFRYPNKSGIME